MLIKFLGPISREDLEVNITDKEDLKKVLKQSIGKEWLEIVAIAVNDKIVNNFDEVKEGDIITVLPPVCGG